MKGVSLIGMPGSGKSTIGRSLAEKLDYTFRDLDAIIAEEFRKPVREIIASCGVDMFLECQEKTAMDVPLEQSILAPGGCIVYSSRTMERLDRETTIIYLNVEREELRRRLQGIMETRGIVGLAEHGFDRLYDHRSKLYERYAHKTVSIKDQNEAQVLAEVLQALDQKSA